MVNSLPIIDSLPPVTSAELETIKQTKSKWSSSNPWKTIVKTQAKNKAKKKEFRTKPTAELGIVDHLDNDLISAARQGVIPDVQKLLTQSATNGPIYHEQWILKAFFAAARSNQADVVVMLIKECQVAPDVENWNGKTALQMAVEAGNGKTTRVLIENGADPFGGVESPYDIANRLWTKQALEMLKDKI